MQSDCARANRRERETSPRCPLGSAPRAIPFRKNGASNASAALRAASRRGDQRICEPMTNTGRWATRKASAARSMARQSPAGRGGSGNGRVIGSSASSPASSSRSSGTCRNAGPGTPACATRNAASTYSTIRVAQAGVPGPAFLQVPLDLLLDAGDDAEEPMTRPLPEPPRPAGDWRAIERAAEALRVAQRPVFVIGSQIRWSPRREAARSAADAFEAPFFLNGMARGALPRGHRGLVSRSRRFALAQSDCIFMFGTPFDFRVDYGRPPTWPADATIVQVDLDGAELGRNRRVDVAIHGDVGLVLEQLVTAVVTKDARAWLETVRAEDEARRARMHAEARRDDSPPNPLRV